MLLSIYPSTNEKSWISEVWKRMCLIYPIGSMVLLCMVTLTINIPPMLAYIWLLIKIPLSRNGHSSRKKILLSRTPCLSFAGPMFTTCQITPENHGSLLGSLLNMQLASRNPFSGQIFLQSLLAHPLQHAL